MSEAARKLALSTPQGAPPSERSLISPSWDMLLIGGGSVLLAALMSVTLKREAPAAEITWLVFYLSFAVNFPHFLVSYQILYYDFRKEFFKNPRYIWAGIIVPVILVSVIAGAIWSATPKALGYLVNAMFFFVGWHYVKQIFGGIMVTNVMNKFFYNPTERFILKSNLFSLWAISFIAQNIGLRSYTQDGINYSSLNLPPELLDWALRFCYLSFLAVVYTHVQKYIREGRLPAKPAVACFVTIYAWYLPALYQPMFFHMIPFFHSLQYLLFVWTYRRNKMDALVEHPNTPEGRKEWVSGVWGYLLVPVMTGALAFWFLPRYMDSLQLADVSLFGPTLAVFSATVFINVHHYFIDNVIWRGNNPDMKKYLFRTA